MLALSSDLYDCDVGNRGVAMERLRTIEQTIQELKRVDPDTALTSWALRGLIREGKIPCIKIGSKSLLTVESVERFINSQMIGGDAVQ